MASQKFNILYGFPAGAVPGWLHRSNQSLAQNTHPGSQQSAGPGEYQAGLYADSWKLDLIQTINDVLEYARSLWSFLPSTQLTLLTTRWLWMWLVSTWVAIGLSGHLD